MEYRNDSIVRIDNSFLQKNQYGASSFVYKNQICLFGGSGLFTDKNFITKFDFKSMEWFRFFPKGKEEPGARSNNLNYFNHDGLYIFGGWTNLSKATFEKDSSLWFFNFNTLEWNRIGNYNENLQKIISESPDKYYTFQTEKKLYLQNSSVFLEIDFKKNKINYFNNKNIVSWINPYFDFNTKSLVYLQYLTGSDYLKLESIPIADLLNCPIKTEKLYYSPWQEYLLPIIWIVFALILLFLLYRWITYHKGKQFLYYQSKNIFYYKSKIISNLDPLEEKILIFLFQNNKTYIQLNQLNSLFEKESSDNFTNVIKKRDLVFSSLLVKLNAIVAQNENPLVLIKKNEVDKRIKEIKLNPMYFTLK